jgi:hypothetical protein
MEVGDFANHSRPENRQKRFRKCPLGAALCYGRVFYTKNVTCGGFFETAKPYLARR